MVSFFSIGNLHNTVCNIIHESSFPNLQRYKAPEKTMGARLYLITCHIAFHARDSGPYFHR